MTDIQVRTVDSHPRQRVRVFDVETSYGEIGADELIRFFHGNPIFAY
jgi:hypothetical protein